MDDLSVVRAEETSSFKILKPGLFVFSDVTGLKLKYGSRLQQQQKCAAKATKPRKKTLGEMHTCSRVT
jgi:hypothetical protein